MKTLLNVFIVLLMLPLLLVGFAAGFAVQHVVAAYLHGYSVADEFEPAREKANA